MKRPSFQFYPHDWMSDIKLRSVSVQARGLLIDLMCIMHQAEPYGTLCLSKKPIKTQAICSSICLDFASYEVLLNELLEEKVLHRDENGIIYSKRMVHDEHVRQVRAAAGSEGGKKRFAQANAQANDKAIAKSKDQAKFKQMVVDEDVDIDGEFKKGGAGGKRKPAQSKIDPEFLPDQKSVEWCLTTYPGVNVSAETTKFVDYFIAKGTRYSDWQQAWKNWMGRAAERVPSKPAVSRHVGLNEIDHARGLGDENDDGSYTL